MSTTEDQIENLKRELESLVKRIQPLRNQVAQLESQLDQAQRDYDREVGPLIAEAAQLRGRIVSLNAAIAGNRAPKPIQRRVPDLTPPDPVIDSPTDPSAPLTVCEHPNDSRKRRLWNHLYFFLNPDQADPEQVRTIQAISAIIKDEGTDIGDMLELLEWGDIWRVRSDWEKPEDQAHRLDEWSAALRQRLNYWERASDRLRKDLRQVHLKEMQKGSQHWLAHLQGLAMQQRQENESLAKKVSDLENKWLTEQAREQDGQ